MSRETLACVSRLLAEALTSLASRVEDPKLLATHEMLHEAVRVFADVGMVIDETGPQLVNSWRRERQRIATIARQN